MKFDHLTKKDGLLSNTILDFRQDKRGFLWIATINGLNRWDGYTFKNYIHDPNDTLSLSGNLVTGITCDSEGKIWVATNNGLNLYDEEKDCFTGIFPCGNPGTSLLGNYVRAILEDEEYLWIETADGILHKLNTKTWTIYHYQHRPPAQVNTYLYHTLLRDPQGMIWVGGRYMGVLRFDPVKETFFEIKEDPNDNNKKRDSDVAIYFLDSQGVFWTGGTDGLYTMDRETGIFKKILSISTFSIVEDSKGNIWIGTGAGMYIYNRGAQAFIQIVHDENNDNSLINDHINKIYIDRSGNIWIGTQEGVSIYRPSKNKFRHLYHIPENFQTLGSDHITCIIEDSKGLIWVGTSNNGVECIDQDFIKITQYGEREPGSHRLVSDNISALMEDSDGEIWIGTWSGKGFHIVNTENAKNNRFQLHKTSLKADWYNDFLQDRKGNFRVGIWGGQGLYGFDKETGRFSNERYVLIYHAIGLPAYSIAHDGRFVWTAIQGQNRFLCLDPESGRYQTYNNDFYTSFDFSKIFKIESDRKGHVWFQTNAGNYLKTDNPYFSFNQSNREIKSKSECGIDVQELEKQLATKILACIRDQSGVLWVGTFGGLLKIKNGKIEKIFHGPSSDNPGLLSDTVWTLDFHPPKELWIGTNQGIYKLDLSSSNFTSYNEMKDRYISSHLVSFVFEDAETNLWVGTTDAGVNRINVKDGRVEQYRSVTLDSSAFWGDEASCIFQDSHNNIWIGGNGLNLFDPDKNVFSHLTSENGLAGNEICAILEDSFGAIWVSTKSGLSRFDPAVSTFQNFYEKDGLQDNEFSKAACKLKNGRLLFGGKNGISVIDPENIKINELPPPVHFTSFKLFGKPTATNLNGTQPILLKYNQNYFSFEFTALDFSDPTHNQYAYMLENFDEDWTYTNALNRSARYTNIGPGKYRLIVQASNSDGIWNHSGTSIAIIISPPFWKTLWFYFLEIALLALVIFGFIKFREQKMKEQNQLLSLEQKLLRSQMNPHFIFNSLSSIQSFIFESNPIEAGSYLSRFAELIRSILYSSREEYITLEKEIQILNNYLDLQKLRYDQKFDYLIDIDPLLEPGSVSIPPMMAQPFIENSIEHGIKHIDDRGLIDISFTLLDEAVLIIVEDNGIGIRAAKKTDQNKAKDHHSLATTITNERIGILNKGKKKKKYYLTIKDSTDFKGHVTGTQVKIAIPFIQI